MLGLRAKLRVAGSRDARLAAIAAQQRGRVSRQQLLAAGIGGGQVDWLIRRDRLFPQHVGVYAVHPGPVERGTETAALLAAPAGALLSHRSAAALWGLDRIAPDAQGRVDVLVDACLSLRRSGIRTHRTRCAARVERRLRERLPVCSAAQVLLDLAPELDERRLIGVHDQALILGVARPRQIERLLARLGTHPGAPRLRALIDELAGRGPTRSEAEQQLLEILRNADLPRPQVNRRIHGYEVDLYWPNARLVVEVDGYRYHSTPAAVERDHVRDQQLRAAGIEVLRVTWRQLQREPLAVVARIAAALARRTRIDAR